MSLLAATRAGASLGQTAAPAPRNASGDPGAGRRALPDRHPRALSSVGGDTRASCSISSRRSSSGTRRREIDRLVGTPWELHDSTRVQVAAPAPATRLPGLRAAGRSDDRPSTTGAGPAHPEPGRRGGRRSGGHARRPSRTCSSGTSCERCSDSSVSVNSRTLTVFVLSHQPFFPTHRRGLAGPQAPAGAPARSGFWVACGPWAPSSTRVPLPPLDR